MSCLLRDAMRISYANMCILGLFLYLLFIGTAVQSLSTTEDSVTCEFTIDVDTATTFSVHISADVEKITLSASGKTYTKSEIQTLSASNPEIMGAIKYAMKAAFSDQLRNTFPDSDIETSWELPSYTAPLFSDSYNISLSPTFFSLNRTVNAYEFINGLMDCGAIVNYSIPLQASAGWNNTFVVVLPNEITYKKTTGTVKQNRITWKVFNGDGQTPQKTAELALADKYPTSEGFSNESLKVAFEIDCEKPRQPQLSILLNAETIDIASYKVLPSLFSNVKTVPSDGIRLLVENNLTNWDKIYVNTLKPAGEDIISVVESSLFNQTIDAVFSWDNTTTTECTEPFDIISMDSLPPIRGLFTDDTILFKLCNISSRAVFGLVNAGAEVHISSSDVNFENNLNNLKYEYNGSILLPPHVFLNDQQRFQWNQTTPISGNFSSDIAPTYTNQNINTDIIIDVESTDMNLLSFFTGKTELTVGVFLSEVQYRNVTTVPEPFKLPSQINLPYLNADGFRLCVEESVFSDEEIESFLTDQTKIFENHSKELFPLLQGKAQVDKNSFEQSLIWNGDISSMNASEPVKVVSTFHSSYPLPFSFSLLPPGFDVSKQNISFTGIPHQSVTYTLVFPQGTSISINDTLQRAMVSETPEGKKCLVVSFNTSEGDLVDIVTVHMQPSGLFILGLFVPCIISMIITIVLFVVVYIIRKKRNRLRGPGGTSETGYEEEEYYVPPPPPRRR